MANTVYDVTTWTGTPYIDPHTDIGAVINQIIADIKANQTTQTTRPGAVIYIPPGHYNLLTKVVIDVSFLQIKGSGHGFLSEAIRDGSSTGSWAETLPGASHIQVMNTDGNLEAFLVSRAGDPNVVGRLNSIEFKDFCLDGVSDAKPYLPGNSKIGISVQSDNDSVRIDGMGFVYLAHAIIVKGADAPSITNNFIAECGNCIELTGASQVAKITNNFLISAWAGYSIYAENAEGPLITGNSILWAANITLSNCNRVTISANKLLSNFPSMIALLGSCSENLISANHFRRVYGDGTSTRFDDLYGLVHIEGNNNTLTGNMFSFNVPAANIAPAGADPTIILVKSGDGNYLATNNIVSNIPAKVVLDASTTATRIIYSAQSGQLNAYTTNYTFIATQPTYSEAYRPQFHYSPGQNWMNDPNGLVYASGKYHLFYQYNPSGSTWGNMSWGHAVSPDLIHWTELPVAIPEDDTYMIFSGSAVVDTGNTSGFGSASNPPLVAIYTAVNRATGIQAQALAYSTDGGQTFTKYSGNPILDIGSTNFRDPKVFWYEPGSQWLMVAALSDQHKVTFYSSPDLKQWTHVNDFGPAGATGGPWECPDLFPLPDPANPGQQKWVLIVNLNPGGIAGGSGSQYFIGSFDPVHGFVPEGVPPVGTLLGSFDSGNFDGWTVTGTAFGSAPATGTLPGQMPVSGWAGTGYANSFNGGDASTGSLSSPDFTIGHRYLNLLVGGGNHPYVPGSVVPGGIPDGVTFADFEGTSYGAGWQATGDFAATGPAAGALPNQNPVSGYIGNQLVNTFTNGDASTGTITSPSFTISKRYVNLLVGGGNHPWGGANPTAVNLVVNGQVVATATGQNSEHLDWVSWDVNAYQGSAATIQIVDQNTGSWGHILVDQIMFGDNPVTAAQDTSVRLVVDGQVVRSATGQNSEHLDWATWDLGDLQGRTARIEIADNRADTSAEAWAHILADQFSLSDASASSLLQSTRWVDFGRDDYAAVTYNSTPDGKRIMIGWMNNWDYGQAIPTSPWRSAMTVPRELTLSLVNGSPSLVQTPIGQLTQLYVGQPVNQQNVTLPPGATPLAASGQALDITATFSLGTASSCGLAVRTGASGQETVVGYDNVAGEVYIDRTNSGNVGFATSFPGVQRAALPAGSGAVKLRVLVDWSSVEVFANDGEVVLSDQIFPDSSSQGVSAFAQGGTASLVSFTANQMGSAWH